MTVEKLKGGVPLETEYFEKNGATVPSLSNPIARANSSTRANSASMSLRKRRRNVAMVSWSGCWFTAINRNATKS